MKSANMFSDSKRKGANQSAFICFEVSKGRCTKARMEFRAASEARIAAWQRFRNGENAEQIDYHVLPI
jgi:hypothetical protein